jgi:3,2-trans-enoyl-CoA isomerase
MKELVQVALKSLPKLGQYGVVTLKNEPVNALNLDVWKQLLTALNKLEQDKSVRGLILQSGITKDIFTAGNDLMELYAPKTTKERYREFWLTQTQFLARLYRSRLVTIACVRGHSPAGGCGIALCCDYRIWTSDTPGARMGLNEVALGILVPKYWGALLAKTVGCQGRAEKMLLFAKMVEAPEALKLGLVDELTAKATLMECGEERMKQMLSLPDVGRQLTKSFLRDEFSRAWEQYGEEEAEMGFTALSSPEMVKGLGKALERLGMQSKL